MDFHHKILNALVDVAEEAGETLLKFYHNGLHKSGLATEVDGQLVTDADRASNALILERLSQAFPEMPVLAEESDDDARRLKSRSLFLVDPLGGTNNFVAGETDFAVSIAYTEGAPGNHQPVIGVVYRPVFDELFVAQKGKGAVLVLNNRNSTLHVSSTKDWKRARLVCSALHNDARTTRLKSLAPIWNGRGSAALMICKVAMGEAEWYAHVAPRHLSEYDIAAADLIMSEAGGRLTDGFGNTVRYNRPGIILPRGVVASNGFCHSQALEVVSSIMVSGAGLPVTEKVREAA
ncbi:MAG TPA: 3'(2'),5'-bisphosphate nucleotidase CysQ [bacterium]